MRKRTKDEREKKSEREIDKERRTRWQGGRKQCGLCMQRASRGGATCVRAVVCVCVCTCMRRAVKWPSQRDRNRAGAKKRPRERVKRIIISSWKGGRAGGGLSLARSLARSSKTAVGRRGGVITLSLSGPVCGGVE